ncbi:MAG: site-specific DNA-methyltransferase [Candidatus Thiocaldithrix dubininis]|uniref:site-specific DNA-methyltransferase (adenine-specific) n=1 Tax=Candidatus Thiocaldithrix dubininis TaxID=3080823 RepID=A0AA95KJZ8_9GAMM|nr:MAG: site-specific DNA-methyltransferase [Candidatus Thiocaldithrix dubininis]
MAKQPEPAQESSLYEHKQEAIQRPDVGVQEGFHDHKPPRQYRYDSSLSPELCWDETAGREFAEWLLMRIRDAAEQGEAAVFAATQVWQGTGEKFRSIRECVARLQTLTQPFLNWTGKAERHQISVPTIPLFVHERHSTQGILNGLDSYRQAGTNLDLFGDPQLDISEKLEAYEHKGPWANRMVLGDSLHVMNSLLEYEGMGGQVQMIYIDPPYGVKFGSNFQPFVRKRDVKHGADDEMIREPEMVKAYRDTWELGLHSYLTYLRDRLLLARELLTESGSVFVQISDDNLHHVREVMDEVFGANNFFSLISFVSTSGFDTNSLARTGDYLLWYTKSKSKSKYNQIYLNKNTSPKDGMYRWLLLPDGTYRGLTASEVRGESEIPSNSRLYQPTSLISQGESKTNQCFNFAGKDYFPPANQHWKTTVLGLQNLASANRIHKAKNSLRYIRLASDFPFQPINNLWDDTATGNFTDEKVYVVQTATKLIERCMLMTTDPGDLVLDPTCGSGTTAYVAEQWGRRWITCDTSRVPLALARQRLLTATFPWYELDQPNRGPAGGFTYTRKQNRKGEETGGKVPRITLKSIANNEEPEMVTLVDKPEINNKITRVCGAFTVEATIQAANSLLHEQQAVDKSVEVQGNAGAYLDRMLEVLRKSERLQLPGNKQLQFDNVRALSSTDYEHLHAEATEKSDTDKRIAIVFGAESGAISSELVFNAASEANFMRFDALYFFGFAIQAKARELLEDRKKMRIPCTYVAVTPDVVMSDLLKTSKSSEIFSITGLPDIAFYQTGEKTPAKEPLYQVKLLGLDIFTPHNCETESIEAHNLPCWMLDTDYNGMSFIARQVFFPKTAAWDNLQKSLKGRFADSVWEHLAGTESEPFRLGERRRIAVKVIDERGNELMVVRDAADAR